MPPDSDPAYAVAIAPMTTALGQLLEQFLELGDLSVGSAAMADLHAETEIVSKEPHGKHNPWGDTPVRTAQSIAQANIVLAADFGRSFLHLVSAETETIIFGFAPVARAALENLARARWILHPGLEMRVRVGRGMNDRIEGLRQQMRLDINDGRQQARERIKSLIRHARELGFEVTKDGRGDKWIEEIRPSSTQLMRSLFYDPEIGAPVYSFLSGVTHGVPTSLSSFFAAEAGSPGSLEIWERRRAVLTAHTTLLVAGLLVMGVIPVLDDQHRYLGREPTAETRRVAQTALHLVQQTFS